MKNISKYLGAGLLLFTAACSQTQEGDQYTPNKDDAKAIHFIQSSIQKEFPQDAVQGVINVEIARPGNKGAYKVYLATKDDAAHMKSGQTLDVGGNRAHAWVEYYQDGLGWLPFEATPTYFSAMEKAEQYQNISGLVGQAPLDYTADNLDDAELENPAAEALREFWLKHRLTILLTLAVLLAAGMVGLLIGWLIFERRRTKKRKEGFFGADAAASIDAIFRYMMDVLRARGMAAKNCPPADYVSYMDEDLREEYLAAAKLWQEARFRGKPMQELQRRRVLRLKDEIWERTWHSASLKERLRLKYVEFL